MNTMPERLTAALADRYRIERELGAGGMATVYLAEDLKHHRKVAVKVLHPELAAVLGAAAEAHFCSELDFVDQVGYGLAKPSVQRWFAWMVLRGVAPGDRDQAHGLLDQAIPAFRSMGMTLSLGQTDDMRRALDG
jgi:serine/threonine protein kinase